MQRNSGQAAGANFNSTPPKKSHVNVGVGQGSGDFLTQTEKKSHVNVGVGQGSGDFLTQTEVVRIVSEEFKATLPGLISERFEAQVPDLIQKHTEGEGFKTKIEDAAKQSARDYTEDFAKKAEERSYLVIGLFATLMTFLSASIQVFSRISSPVLALFMVFELALICLLVLACFRSILNEPNVFRKALWIQPIIIFFSIIAVGGLLVCFDLQLQPPFTDEVLKEVEDIVSEQIGGQCVPQD